MLVTNGMVVDGQHVPESELPAHLLWGKGFEMRWDLGQIMHVHNLLMKEGVGGGRPGGWAGVLVSASGVRGQLVILMAPCVNPMDGWVTRLGVPLLGLAP